MIKEMVRIQSVVLLATILWVSVAGNVRAEAEEGADLTQAATRDVTVPSTVPTTSAKNPSVVTTGTLTILQSVSFTASGASSTSSAVTYSWNFGDGTATDARQTPSHTFTAPGTYTVTVTMSDSTSSVNKSLSVVITDAIKSSKLLAMFDFKKATQDELKLTGIVRVPANSTLANVPVSIDIGGIQCSFTLDENGFAKITSNSNVVSGVVGAATTVEGSFNLFLKNRPEGVTYADAKFYLKLSKGALISALADEFIANRDSDRESLRVVGKITLNGVLYQSTFSPTFSAKKGLKGSLR